MAAELAGQVALVTGGGSGIGRAAAVALAQAGADVAVTSRRGTDLGEVVEAVRATGRRGEAVALDLLQPGAARRAVAEVADRLGRLDVLVNNAGVTARVPALEMSEAQWDEIFDINVRGLFLLSQAAARRMAAGEGGRIVNLSSTFAYTASPDRSAYAASKAAVSQLTRALAIEWAPLGIRVNAVAPCATNTPSRAPVFAQGGVADRLRARIPLGRIPEPEDVVGAIVFLAGPASGFVTGHTLMVDGGWTAW